MKNEIIRDEYLKEDIRKDDTVTESGCSEDIQPNNKNFIENNSETVSLLDIIKSSPFTLLLVTVNIIVYVILEIKGNTLDAKYMLSHGAMNPACMLYDGEWYRIFTAMFMHYGLEHLLNNMVLLFFLGRMVEKATGLVKYTAIYFISGFLAGFTSFFWMLLTGQNNIACGASGAIFGLVGAMLLIILVHKGRYEGITLPRMILMAILVLYFGFATAGTDNAGHVGGLIAGFLSSIFIYGIPFLIKSKFKRNPDKVDKNEVS